MVWIFFVALLALWGAGVITGTLFGGSLHLLLFAAILLLFLDTLRSGRSDPA